MIVARDLGPDLFAAVCREAALRESRFPSVARFAALAVSAALRRGVRASALSEPPPPPRTLRQAVAEHFGVEPDDQTTWSSIATAARLPANLVSGLFLRPTRERAAALIVSSQAAKDAWTARTRARARDLVAVRLVATYGPVALSGLTVIVLLGLNDPHGPHVRDELATRSTAVQ